MITTSACATRTASADIPRLDRANPSSPIFQLVMPKRKHDRADTQAPSARSFTGTSHDFAERQVTKERPNNRSDRPPETRVPWSDRGLTEHGIPVGVTE